MPALTHNRVKNGFNGGRRLLNANAGIKFGRTIGATTADATRSDALVGGIGPRSKFVRRAINNRAITSKQGGCCHNMDKESPRAILYYSSPGPYKSDNLVTITAVFDKMMDGNFNVKIAISGVSVSLSPDDMNRVNSTTYTYSHTMGSGNGENTIVLSNGKDIVGNILDDVAKNNTFEVDNIVPIITAIATGDFSWGTVLNGIEDNTDGTVSVTTTGVENGQTVTITLDSTTYTNTVINNATTVTITAVGLQALTDGSNNYSLKADVSDAAGNAAIQITSSTFSVDKIAPMLAQVQSIPSASNNQTPSYFFTTTKAGTITTSITQGFSTVSTAATTGNNQITFKTLPEGTYNGETITVTDSAGNIGNFTIPTFTIDTTAPIISSVNLTSNTTIDTADIGYTLSKAIASGTVVWTRTSGATDNNTPHTKALVGTELNSGTRAMGPLINAPTLVSGTTYTVTFNATDAASNTAATITITEIKYQT